jgi:hypothetical protein
MKNEWLRVVRMFWDVSKMDTLRYRVIRCILTGCRVCFVAHEYAAGENGCQLDGHTVHITDMFTCDDDNHLIRNLNHHNRGYGYTRVVGN